MSAAGHKARHLLFSPMIPFAVLFALVCALTGWAPARAEVDAVARGLAASRVCCANGGGTIAGTGANLTIGTTLPSAQPVPSIRWAAGAAGGAPIISAGGPLFNGTVDPSLYMGINQDQTGALLNGSYQGLAYALENNYNDGVSIKQETYFQAVFTDGSRIRPFFWQIEPSTKTITGAHVRAGSTGFSILDDTFSGIDAGGNTIATFVRGLTTINPPAAGDTALDILALASQNAVLKLGRGGVSGYLTFAPLGAETAGVTLNSVSALYIYSKAQGTVGAAAIAVGEGNNAGAGFFRAGFTGHKAIIAKAFSASQSADLIEAQDSNGNVQAGFDKNGRAFSRGTAPALTSCGTSPTITGGDNAFTITEGSAATGCTATFALAFAAAPTCVPTSQDALGFTYAVSTTAVTITNVGALSSKKIDVVCFGH